MSSDPKVGLVLSGGGARGAYEVGVLRFVRERLGITSAFHVITGSSVGAINGSYIAATCDKPKGQARALARVWRDANLDEVYHFGWRELRRLPTSVFGRDLPVETHHGSALGGIVAAGAMQRIVRERIPWGRIARNLAEGRLGALACSATELTHGTTTVFVQSREPIIPFSPVPGQIMLPATISPEHALASAAIPVLFPAVRIGTRTFVDGSLRQNTPIRPAIHLGANRLLVVGLRSPPRHIGSDEEVTSEQVFPNTLFLVGKMLSALMLDKLEGDLARIQRTNEMLDAGIATYGPDFAQKISAAMTGREGRPYQRIEVVLIRPSRDLGAIAWDVIRETKLRSYRGLMARWLRGLPDQTNVTENDVASYVLFDREYIARLIDLGYEDARARESELLQLFGGAVLTRNLETDE